MIEKLLESIVDELKVINHRDIQIKDKVLLTLEEASEYFGIGITRLREFINNHYMDDFHFMNGSKHMIKRKQFEKWIDTHNHLDQ